MAKLWAGRFSESTNSKAEKLNQSIFIDYKLFPFDIQGSIAHGKMLGEIGVLSEYEVERIVDGLTGLLQDWEKGYLDIDPASEDVHMFIEEKLTERIGETGKKIHTGRSRNDQVALDLKLYLRDALLDMMEGVELLIKVLLDLAEDHVDTLMPGFTHLQKAQPITFGYYLCAYVEMLQRDAGRIRDCIKRNDTMPLGSGALAGTTYPIRRESVAAELGFTQVTGNGLDSVSDRDHGIEALSAISIGMMHLSRFAEDFIIYSSDGFRFIEFSEGFSTGSSIMPQKRNPDIAELIRGKTGRVYGDLMGLLTLMKGLPLSYNKDMQEDKEFIFDGVETYLALLEILPEVLCTLNVRKDSMEKALRVGFLNSTEMADYMVSKGVPFRTAHEYTGKIVRAADQLGTSLEEMGLDEMKKIWEPMDSQIYEWLDYKNAVHRRNHEGGTAPEAVLRYIKRQKDLLGKD